MKRTSINWLFLAVTILLVSGLFGIGWHRIQIDTDIVGALPDSDPVIADAAYLFRHHPMQGQVVIDVFLDKTDLEALIACARKVQKRLKASGLFKAVGIEDTGKLMPDLLDYVSVNLPVLFTADELRDLIQPLLQPAMINQQLEQIRSSLLGLDSIGQTALIAKDPLDFRRLVLARLSHLAPSTGARIYRGQLLSADDRHILIVARPVASGTDTVYASQLTELMNDLSVELNREYRPAGQRVTLTPVGAYRSALDNEQIIRKDVTYAIALATLGIAMLLLFAFPRPAIGLFSLVPAVAGTMLALFVFSLFHKSLSIMVLGFGGAIISITVDQGIAYLLFLDRPYDTSGREASEEVWNIGLLAVLTSIGAFGALCFSGFSVFVQLGQFTMLGIALSFLFVHVIFPHIFPRMPAGRPRSLHLQKVADALARTGTRGLWVAVVFASVMLIFAQPEFNVSMRTMNTVGADTIAAEKLLADVWGDIFSKVHLLAEGQSIAALQAKDDILLDQLDRDLASGVLSSGFVPSMLFPSHERRKNNFNAWKQFWNGERVESLERTIGEQSAALGFAPGAFSPFYEMLSAVKAPGMNVPIPAEFLSFLGISELAGESKWIQVSTFTTGPAYDAKQFHDTYGASGRLFDPAFFSERLGKHLFDTFSKLFLIIAVSVIILLIFFFLDPVLVIICLLPVAFALISTLGTLNIIGHPLDIPGLMLSIIVLGMGIDYSLFFVRSFQRYGALAHPSFGLIRLAVFMSAVSTMIGFGVLCGADHTLLKSAGITSLLGITYSVIGAYVILPPALSYVQRRRRSKTIKSGRLRDRVLSRYQGLEAYPRLFARFKMRLDPMFLEIAEIFKTSGDIKTIIDIGCGFGVPSCWLLERFPHAELFGIEPSAGRVRVASVVVGGRGDITQGRAPDIPAVSRAADLAMMLDMVHFLNDEDLVLTLGRLHDRLLDNGRLVIRAAVRPRRRFPWAWWLENFKLWLSHVPVCYRSPERLKVMVSQAGFRIENTLPSGNHQELVWLIGCVDAGSGPRLTGQC